jgi:hypothetical protein
MINSDLRTGMFRIMITHQSYAFIKSKLDFEKNEKDVELNDGNHLHKLTKIKKILKPNASSDRETPWFKNQADQIREEYKSRLNRIVVLSGELFRLSDRHLPKYRIYSNGKEEMPISKEVVKAQNFYSYFEKYIYPYWSPNHAEKKIRYTHNPVFDGMGRSFLRKYLYYDHDFHQDNALIDDKKYFHVIDHDWCFAKTTKKMHQHNTVSSVDEKGERERKVRVFKHDLSLRDYDNLPDIRDSNMGTWVWSDRDNAYYAYMDVVSKDVKFLSEKHFSALSCLVTQHLQQSLVAYHLENEEDKKNITVYLTSIFHKLPIILKQSAAFMKYICDNRIQAMQAVMFELNDFLLQNRHYLPSRDKDQKESKVEWRKRVFPQIMASMKQLISTYSHVLTQLNERPLDPIEKTYLEHFAVDICQDKPEALAHVKLFYSEQGMQRFAGLVDQYLPSPTPPVKKIGLFKSAVLKISEMAEFFTDKHLFVF